MIEDQTDPTRIHLVGRPQRGGGVQLILRYLNQEGAVRESQGQPTNISVLEGFRAVNLILHLALHFRLLQEPVTLLVRSINLR